jgi:hypothetical protein
MPDRDYVKENFVVKEHFVLKGNLVMENFIGWGLKTRIGYNKMWTEITKCISDLKHKRQTETSDGSGN